MISPAIQPTKILVVDPQPNDYDSIVHSLVHSRSLGRVDFRFHRDGKSLLRDQMRDQSAEYPDLCVINVNLPDMSGIDVFKMVSDRWPGVRVYLVGDDYRPEDEIKARTSGAMFYFCKPLQSTWLAAAAESRN